MGTKEEILALFEEQRGVYFSGEEIAAQLSVSRTAVWKAVNSLKEAGYEIDAVKNRGYRLAPETDILSEQGVEKYVNPVSGGLQLSVVKSTASTNSLLREQAAGGQSADEETDGVRVVIANRQTGGRGRSGRSFFSPADTGIYMSILLRPKQCLPKEAMRFTTMAAVAACEAIEEISGESAGIKWVNDIYMRGKKVCGILTEASFGMESGYLESAVLGVGINVYPPKEGFPPELEEIAGAVFAEQQSDGKNRLAAEFLNRFLAYYTRRDRKDYRECYRQRSLAIGRQVQVLSPQGNRPALALDVDEDCRLVVRYENGETERLSSGEISVRLA